MEEYIFNTIRNYLSGIFLFAERIDKFLLVEEE